MLQERCLITSYLNDGITLRNISNFLSLSSYLAEGLYFIMRLNERIIFSIRGSEFMFNASRGLF